MRGGVSLAGGEFGVDNGAFCNRAPGTYGRDYAYPSEQTISYFASRGLGLLRIPFRWERLQPELGQPLQSAELARLRQVAACAADNGAAVILDMHNYGRYRLSLFGKPRTVVIDERLGKDVPVTRAYFADAWRRLAEAFAGVDAIAGYGLMNEPHDMGQSNWKAISQAAVDAVRTTDDDTVLLVAGNAWSNAHRFVEANGLKAWIEDRANRVMYEAHCYLDADASGKYRRSFADELRDDPDLLSRGVRRFAIFRDWCRRNDATGFVGEFGIPGAGAGWRDVLERLLKALCETSMSACYWAAGEWWHDYPLSVQPRDDLKEAAPQMELLMKYLAARSRA